jgi:hypothetical protein
LIQKRIRWQTYRGAARQERIARRRELRQRAIVPCRVTMVYRVDLELMEVPEWAVAEAVASRVLRELSRGEWHVWLTRRSAKLLLRQAGGHGRLTEVEYRICPVCERVLLGEDAEERRRLNESCMTGTQLPCGKDCLDRYFVRRSTLRVKDRKAAAKITAEMGR